MASRFIQYLSLNRFLGKKDIVEVDLSKHNNATHPFMQKMIDVIFYFIEYMILFPLFTFFWFVMLTSFLVFLSKEPSIANIMLVSMALVCAIRVTAYYNEDLSRDLAKMFPFALLGVFLIDINSFSFMESIEVMKQTTTMLDVGLYYFGFVIAMELTLRILHGIRQLFKPLDSNGLPK